MMNVSAVIPVFNASGSLPIMLERLAHTLTPICTSFEVILVDDCSTDESWLMIQELSKHYPWIVGKHLGKNAGQHIATLVGLRFARFPISVVMDDDLQHMPESIPTMLAALTSDVDIVYAAPAKTYKPFVYRLLSALAKAAIAFFSGASFLRHMQSFRAFHTAVYPWADLVIYRSMTIEGVLATKYPRSAVVRVPYASRNAGRSTYTFKRSVKLALNIWHSVRTPPEQHMRNTSSPPINPTAEIGAGERAAS